MRVITAMAAEHNRADGYPRYRGAGRDDVGVAIPQAPDGRPNRIIQRRSRVQSGRTQPTSHRLSRSADETRRGSAGIGAAAAGRPGRADAEIRAGADRDARRQPVSPYQVMAGTVIAGALVTGIKSDLPVRIIVSRDLVLRPYQPLFFNKGTSR